MFFSCRIFAGVNPRNRVLFLLEPLLLHTQDKVAVRADAQSTGTLSYSRISGKDYPQNRIYILPQSLGFIAPLLLNNS